MRLEISVNVVRILTVTAWLFGVGTSVFVAFGRLLGKIDPVGQEAGDSFNVDRLVVFVDLP